MTDPTQDLGSSGQKPSIRCIDEGSSGRLPKTPNHQNPKSLRPNHQNPKQQTPKPQNPKSQTPKPQFLNQNNFKFIFVGPTTRKYLNL